MTGERAVIRIGTNETAGELLAVDLYIRPGAAVMGEHTHSTMDERFTVAHGQVGSGLAEQAVTAEPAVTLFVPPGVPHDWWNEAALADGPSALSDEPGTEPDRGDK